MYDLTQAWTDGMQTFPGDPGVSIEPAATVEADGYRVTDLACGSHTGTHIDAPSHTEADGAALSAFPVEAFRFDARRVDLRGKAAREPILPVDLPITEAADAGADCLALWTGWDAHWGSERYLDHPYLAPETAATMAEAGLALAVDCLNPDPTPSPNAVDGEPSGFEAHHALLGEACLILENLTNLGGPPERFVLHAYPLKLGGDGAPVRAVAESHEESRDP